MHVDKMYSFKCMCVLCLDCLKSWHHRDSAELEHRGDREIAGHDRGRQREKEGGG